MINSTQPHSRSEGTQRLDLQHWEEVLLDLIGASSVTGNERGVAILLESHLAKNFPDAQISRQYISDDRWNVIMQRGNPRLTLTTHIDVVPGGPPPCVSEDYIFGRGACDAKGQIIAQLWGLQQAVRGGVCDYRCAYVVGEEIDSVGAQALIALPTTEYILNGEPTKNRFISRSWGALEVKVTTQGTEAHSSLGTDDSAIHKLIMEMYNLNRDVPPGISINIGLIQGGTAPNIQAGSASCDLCIRTRNDAAPAREFLQRRLKDSVWLEKSLPIEGLPLCVPDFAQEKDVEVRFASDCSIYARAYPNVMLFGPGDIADAHTDTEKIGRRELKVAADYITQLVLDLESR